MWFRRFKKDIAIEVTWRDSNGKTKSIMRQVVSDTDNTAIIMYPDGQELQIKIYAVEKGTIYGQFLPGGKYG